jgi:hypothetical protein
MISLVHVILFFIGREIVIKNITTIPCALSYSRLISTSCA